MKTPTFLCLLIPFFVLSQHSDFIHVDQFGYKTLHTKVAVISNPQIGFNNIQSYNPSITLELRNANTNTVVYSGNSIPWNSGNTHLQSGDQGWWFDFSTYTTPGDYYIHDAANNESSAIFKIGNTVYDEVLITASKMFYYNRCGIEKTTPFVLNGFQDSVNFSQDEFSRDIYDQSNSTTAKDMRGGWFDAGDYNKYVTFAESAVHDLLWAYRTNPSVFTDNFNIPESGNGIPDIIDEIKWETDWLLKMMNPDGSVHIKIGSRNYSENSSAPPSINTETRYYAPVCTSSSIALASMLAHASKIFSDFPSLTSYASQLETAAELAWSWSLPFLNTDTLQIGCDDGSVVSGDADRSVEDQRKSALTAAVYLFDLTGDNQYNQYFIDNINDTNVINNGQWDNYNIVNIDALLHYTTLFNADTALKNTILNSAETSATNNYNNYFQFNSLSLYRDFSNDWTYHWGSNSPKASMGNLNLIFNDHQINTSETSTYKLRAKETLHYFHGVNPLDLVYLSNMNSIGAEHSINQIYHGWFNDGTIWDDASTSTYGPAPGFLVGGCNPSYTANTSLSPPYNQPLQKSYLDFNTGFPDNSWEISEPAIYYQAAYVRLLSRILNLDENDTLSDQELELSNVTLKLVPNPSDNEIKIVSNEIQNFTVSISNLNGQTILKNKTVNTNQPFNISLLDSGIYFLYVKNNHQSRTFKLIKK